jgi:hypothetical protein
MMTELDALRSFRAVMRARAERDPALRLVDIDASQCEDGSGVLVYVGLSDGDTAVVAFSLKPGERWSATLRVDLEVAFSTVGLIAIAARRAPAVQ